MVSLDTMVSVGAKSSSRLSTVAHCSPSRPKGAYGTTDEAFVLILHVCLSPPDSNSKRLHTGKGATHPPNPSNGSSSILFQGGGGGLS